MQQCGNTTTVGDDKAQDYPVGQKDLQRVMGFIHARPVLSYAEARQFSSLFHLHRSDELVVPKDDILKACQILDNTVAGSEEAKTAIEFLSALKAINQFTGKHIKYLDEQKSFHFVLKLYGVVHAADIFLDVRSSLAEALENINAIKEREKAHFAEAVRIVEDAHITAVETMKIIWAIKAEENRLAEETRWRNMMAQMDMQIDLSEVMFPVEEHSSGDGMNGAANNPRPDSDEDWEILWGDAEAYMGEGA